MTASQPFITGVDFVTIFTDDFENALEFYGKVLELPFSKRYEGMPGAEFETGNLTLQVFASKSVGIEFEPSKHPIALRVADVEAARTKLESRGVSFNGDILDSGVCHMAFFEDPEGNALVLHHRYAPQQ
jgi:predicted enzyme related to lactoylglutathione lyase